jgi:hypothetical protein
LQIGHQSGLANTEITRKLYIYTTEENTGFHKREESP